MCSGPLERTKSVETWIIVRCVFSFNSYYPSFFRGKCHFKANFRPVQNRSPPDMFCSFLTERACEHFGSKCGAFVLPWSPCSWKQGGKPPRRGRKELHGAPSFLIRELRRGHRQHEGKKRKRNKTKGGEECFLHQM